MLIGIRESNLNYCRFMLIYFFFCFFFVRQMLVTVRIIITLLVLEERLKILRRKGWTECDN